jgi:hypothetical protein
MERIVALAVPLLYSALMVVVAVYAILWSDWPEKRGRWLFAVKQKLPPRMRLWNPRYTTQFCVICFVLFLLLSYLDYKAVKPLIFP